METRGGCSGFLFAALFAFAAFPPLGGTQAPQRPASAEPETGNPVSGRPVTSEAIIAADCLARVGWLLEELAAQYSTSSPHARGRRGAVRRRKGRRGLRRPAGICGEPA
jgi:hypothetical protein